MRQFLSRLLSMPKWCVLNVNVGIGVSFQAMISLVPTSHGRASLFIALDAPASVQTEVRQRRVRIVPTCGWVTIDDSGHVRLAFLNPPGLGEVHVSTWLNAQRVKQSSPDIS